MDTRISKIIDIVKNTFPNAKPSRIYSIPNGFLVIAPAVKNDVNDPQYFVDSSITTAKRFDMRKMDVMFKAFASEPIWNKGR